MSFSGTTLEASVLDRLGQTSTQADGLHAELEHLHRLALIGTLAAGVAHEINNILTPVLAYAQLAQSPNADPEIQRKALRKSMRGAEQVTAISQALLGFAARSENEDSASANVAEAFDRTIDCLGRDPASDGVEVINNLPTNLCVQIQPVALQQVLMNIVLNALYVLRKTNGTLELRAEQQGGEVAIRVIDNGPGIPETIRDRLFEPFVTADVHNEASRSTGTGLGLAVCRMLIEAADGRIEAHSASGQGTTFTIHLPAAEPMMEDGSQAA